MIIFGIIAESFRLLAAMSPYLLLGFIFAGILKVLLPEEKVVSHLGKGAVSSSIKASILGIPLPLCSCGVIPASVSLRRQGANKGATLSFLISTPTTGIDSILATYSLLGPVFTAFRVITSFITAVLCGIAANLFFKEKAERLDEGISCNICGEESEHTHNIFDKLRYMFHYAFIELLDDIGKWLIIGILIGGFISYVVPDALISRYLGSDLKAMMLMLLIGIPIYVCATGSIPIVAALMLKGMSPGAGLVFLLAGPATNTVTIAVITKELGKKATFLYLFFISLFSIIAGMVLNILWPAYKGFIPLQREGVFLHWIKIFSSVALICLMLYSFLKKLIEKKRIKEVPQENEIILNVADMNCQHCVRSIKDALSKLKDIDKVEVDLSSKKVKISSNNVPDIDNIMQTIISLGFKPDISK